MVAANKCEYSFKWEDWAGGIVITNSVGARASMRWANDFYDAGGGWTIGIDHTFVEPLFTEEDCKLAQAQFVDTENIGALFFEIEKNDFLFTSFCRTFHETSERLRPCSIESVKKLLERHEKRVLAAQNSSIEQRTAYFLDCFRHAQGGYFRHLWLCGIRKIEVDELFKEVLLHNTPVHAFEKYGLDFRNSDKDAWEKALEQASKNDFILFDDADEARTYYIKFYDL